MMLLKLVFTVLKEKTRTSTAGSDNVRDEFNGVWYAKYSFGPVSIGYSESYVDSGVSGTAEVATDAAKTLRTSGGYFEGTTNWYCV